MKIFSEILKQSGKVLRKQVAKNRPRYLVTNQPFRLLSDQPAPCTEILSPACKVAIIFGGTSGIGLAVANELLNEKAKGVVIASRDECIGLNAAKELCCFFGTDKAHYVKADVKQLGSVQGTFKKCFDLYGQIDMVVNAAGICDGQHWEDQIDTNLNGVIRATLAARDCLKCNGVIVNFSGLFGLRTLGGNPALSAAQHGTIGFCRSYGLPVVACGTKLRVVTFCPGVTKGNFFRDVEKRLCCGIMKEVFNDEMKDLTTQMPGYAGKAVVHLIKYAESGSTWVFEGDKLYIVCYPDFRCSMKLVTTYL